MMRLARILWQMVVRRILLMVTLVLLLVDFIILLVEIQQPLLVDGMVLLMVLIQ